MNENDLNRYLWRAGQRWSIDDWPAKQRAGSGPRVLTVVFVFVSFVLTAAILLLHN